ncbi:MFS general substrate transporter [Thozetella sp. PMI_491]|nr:MFS general substrate transporter [Thozetella sp. PMI_491]
MARPSPSLYENAPEPSVRGQQQDPETQTLPDNGDKVYPKGLNLTLLCTAMILANMCRGLDLSIISTALPRITEEFNSLSDVGWYGSAYPLTTCCFQLLFGKLYVEFSIKWVFLIAVGIFELGSVMCAIAPSSFVLILGRAVAGLGGAGIFTGTFLIMALSVPMHERAKFIGINGGFAAVAQVMAPFLGGVFTDSLSWRWCFWINLPLGGVTILVVLFMLRLPEQAGGSPSKSVWELLRKFDIVGTIFFLPATVSLLLALQWGGEEYPWDDWRVVLLLCTFGVTIVAWGVTQRRLGDHATVPLRIVRQRSVAASLWMMFCRGSYGTIVIQYVPMWFQTILNVSAYQSGLNLLATSGSMALVTLMSGYMTSFIGYYVPQMYLCAILGSISTGMIYSFDVHTTTTYWAAALVIYGFSAGMSVQPCMMVAQTVLDGTDMSIAMALMLFTQNLSGSVFMSAGNSVLQGRLVDELRRLVPQVNPAAVMAAGAANLEAQMQKIYPKHVGGIMEAYSNALRAVFLIAAVLAAISIFGATLVEWKCVKEKSKVEEKDEESEDLDGERR